MSHSNKNLKVGNYVSLEITKGHSSLILQPNIGPNSSDTHSSCQVSVRDKLHYTQIIYMYINSSL